MLIIIILLKNKIRSKLNEIARNVKSFIKNTMNIVKSMVRSDRETLAWWMIKIINILIAIAFIKVNPSLLKANNNDK